MKVSSKQRIIIYENLKFLFAKVILNYRSFNNSKETPLEMKNTESFI